jgi:hypothetical protein
MRETGDNPETAYLKLQAFIYQNNLDINKPIQPQIEALSAARNGEKAATTVQHATKTPPSMPIGRGGNGTALNDGVVSHKSSDDIIREAMREGGLIR